MGSLFLGGFIGRALLDKVGASTTFLIGTGFRVLIALSWLGVSGRKPVDITKNREGSVNSGKSEMTEKGDERV